jgi:hypothetical protein
MGIIFKRKITVFLFIHQMLIFFSRKVWRRGNLGIFLADASSLEQGIQSWKRGL